MSFPLPPAGSDDDPFSLRYAALHPSNNPIPSRSLPTDTLQCRLYAIHPSPATHLTAVVLPAVNSLLTSWTSSHIWQRSPLGPAFTLTNATSRFPYLSSFLPYGDSIDDEWLLTSLLITYSRQDPSVWLQLTDSSDDEFLLVAAAHALPRWLDPGNAPGRVWVSSGRLLLIPPSSRPVTALPLETALRVIEESNGALSHLPALQRAAFERARGFPDKIEKEMRHNAMVRVPRTVAAVLRHHPRAVAAATDAFYIRDPIAMNALRKPAEQRKFELRDWVDVSVRFTRVLYAQLIGQVWQPPDEWFGACTEDAQSVGVKVTAGLEMVAADKGMWSEEVRGMVVLGEGKLPSDEEIASWGKRSDPEEWLNVGFEDFVKGLEGDVNAHWGDEGKQEMVKRMVERLEKFVGDEGVANGKGSDSDNTFDVGGDGDDENEDEDEDDEESDHDGDDDEDDDDDDFDERFSQMMRDMMGLPPDFQPKDEEEKEDLKEIMQMQNEIETELRRAGALEVTGNDEVDEKAQVLKNMLESFGAQAGMAGPSGNLLATLGVRLPRDEREEDVIRVVKGKKK